ncbi:MAG TPA: hypothetical protein PK239_18455 [Chitinophagales bacterium]|nr:hypothetical protein [Chitinophagales bacterium]HRK29264.1 hypothetical protein [Chitinophagales bacterium]
MKIIRFVLVALILCSALSSCAAIKKRKCDCPRFSDRTMPTEQVQALSC